MLLPACFKMADLFPDRVETFKLGDAPGPPGEGKPTKFPPGLFYCIGFPRAVTPRC
jgi:hypothetical protein